jgi:hypothetical protein
MYQSGIYLENTLQNSKVTYTGHREKKHFHGSLQLIWQNCYDKT